MEYITVTTPENFEIQYRCAGLGSRMAAAAIDGMVIALAVAITSANIVFFAKIGENARVENWAGAVWIIVTFVIVFGYFIIIEYLTKGQSLGKRIFKLRAIGAGGHNITLRQSIARNLLRNFVDVYGVGIAMMLCANHHKRLGDFVAGTVVIDESAIEFKRCEISGVRSFTIVGQTLSDAEYDALYQYFKRKDGFTGGGEKLKRELISYFSRKFDARQDEESLRDVLASNRR
ncbi:MAG: RDD family protein [Clostridiales bacterium]|jgi:uncharacterized RDD family membrane protein YckC|nr:RDD family protein [Clostridiales bacterium]